MSSNVYSSSLSDSASVIDTQIEGVPSTTPSKKTTYKGHRYLSPCMNAYVRCVINTYNCVMRFFVAIFFCCCKTLHMRVKDFVTIKMPKRFQEEEEEDSDDDLPPVPSLLAAPLSIAVTPPKSPTEQETDVSPISPTIGIKVILPIMPSQPGTPPKKISPANSEAGISDGELVEGEASPKK